ncbi:MAG TPA: response regulator transcription factor [Candidatus Paceibacterota bacterium]|nr:response regulator transcription factor [Candidatus Paceibacterota bacterium]
MAKTISACMQNPWVKVIVDSALTAEEGLQKAGQNPPHFVVMRPDFTDASLARAIGELKSFSSTPILVLGYHGSAAEEIDALAEGADEFVSFPPRDLKVLEIRIWNVLRTRAGMFLQPVEEMAALTSGELMLNPGACEISLNTKRMQLTPTEFRVLYLLMRNRGNVLSHQFFGDSIWGDEVDSSGLVKKYIQKLRRKLGDDVEEPRWIDTVPRVGYRFVGPVVRAIPPMPPLATFEDLTEDPPPDQRSLMAPV